MAIEVKVAAIFQRYLGGARGLQIQGRTVREALDHLETRYPGFKSHVLSGSGVHQFVNIFVNDEDIRFLKQLDTSLADGDVISILPAVVGGRPWGPGT